MMIQFWMAAAVLCALASAFIIVPLLRARLRADKVIENDDVEGQDMATLNVALYEERLAELELSLAAGDLDDDSFEMLKREQQQALLADADPDAQLDAVKTAPVALKTSAGRAPLLAALLVPVLAVLSYADFGLGWGAIADEQLARELHTQGRDVDDIGASVENLALRLKKQPDNDEGWFLLGQSYMRMGEFSSAADAFGHLAERYPGDANLATREAEMLFLADDRQLTPRVRAAIDRTLVLDPSNIAMLEIKAMDAFNKRDLAGALNWFRKALEAGASGERAELISQAVARLEMDLGLEPSQALAETAAPTQAPVTSPNIDVPPAKPQTATGTAGRRLQVLVELAPSVSAQANARVFVFARAVAGPPMPLAVKELALADLPQLVTLDETMAMMPGMGLANFDKVQLVARISSSGIANASPDDYEALSSSIDLTGANGVVVLTLSSRIRDK